MSLNIRLATEEDLAGVAEIYNSYLGKSTMDLQQATASNYRKYLTADREQLSIAEINGKLIGWSLIKKYSDRIGYGKSCETSTFFVASAIGKGYGTTLKKHTMESCLALGYTHLVAKIMSINKTSINYNLKLGYEIVGEQKNIGFINGKYHNVTIMQYNFPTPKDEQ